MRKQILTLIIGILIGSIITTGVFLVIKKNEKNNVPDFSEFRNRMRNSSESDGEDNLPSNYKSRRNNNEENEEEQSN